MPGIDPHDEALAERLLTDFPFFLSCLWKHLPYGRLAPLTDIELDIAAWMADQTHPRRGVLAPRGRGKSHLACAYAAFRLLQDPDTKILFVSKSKIPHAQDSVRTIREWLSTIPFLTSLNPKDHASELATDQAFQFDVAGSSGGRFPSVRGIGIDGHITGGRAHVVIADDIETPNNTKTIDARAELDEKVKELFNIAKFGRREQLYLGTYHHPDSLYIKLNQRGYVFRTWPLTYPKAGERFLGLAPLVAKKAASHQPGEAVFAVSSEEIVAAMAEGTSNWQSQYQLVLDRTGETERPLKLSDLIVYPCLRDKAPIGIAWGTTNNMGQSTALDVQVVGWDGDRLHAPIFVDPEWGTFTGTKAWLDPSGRGKDLTGLAIIGHLGGIFWLKGLYGLPGGASTERMDEIVRLLKLHGARECWVETNIDTFNTYVDLLEAAVGRGRVAPGTDPAMPEGWACHLERKHSTGQKELRIIAALEPVMSSHRLVVHPDAILAKPDRPRDHEIQWMIAALTRERGCLKEDGPIDALAGCVSVWTDSLRLDPAKQTLANRSRLIDELLKEQRRLAHRDKPTPSWIRPISGARP